MHLVRIGRIAVLVVAIAPLARTLAADWPQWRGPEGTGVSPEKGLPIVWQHSMSRR